MEPHRVTYRVTTLAVIVIGTENLEDCWKEFRDNASHTAGVKCALGCCVEWRSCAVRRCDDEAAIEGRLVFAVRHHS